MHVPPILAFYAMQSIHIQSAQDPEVTCSPYVFPDSGLSLMRERTYNQCQGLTKMPWLLRQRVNNRCEVQSFSRSVWICPSDSLSHSKSVRALTRLSQPGPDWPAGVQAPLRLYGLTSTAARPGPQRRHTSVPGLPAPVLSVGQA